MILKKKTKKKPQEPTYYFKPKVKKELSIYQPFLQKVNLAKNSKETRYNYFAVPTEIKGLKNNQQGLLKSHREETRFYVPLPQDL